MPYLSLAGQIPFVGRKDLLEHLLELRSLLEEGRERSRHVVLVEGFAGVGKSALVEEYVARLAADGHMFVARGAYAPGLRRQALAPFVDALEDLLGDPLLERRASSLLSDPVYRPLLDRLSHPKTTHNGQIGHTPSGDGADVAPLIASLLSRISQIRPAMLVIDDMQWMPEEDRASLAELNLGLRDAPVIIVGVARRERVATSPILSSLDPLLRDRIYVPPLNAGEVSDLVSRLLSPRVAMAIAQPIAHVSEGVPFQVLEIVRSLIERGAIRQVTPGEWSVSSDADLRFLEDDTLVDRLRQLDRCQCQLLLLLDCVGGIASRGELVDWCRRLSSQRKLSCSMDVEEAISTLEADGLLKPAYADPSSMTFGQHGIREAQRRGRTADDVSRVAMLILSESALRLNAGRWIDDLELFRTILSMLPPVDSIERVELLDQLVGRSVDDRIRKDDELLAQIYDAMLEAEDHLTSREIARTLAHAISAAHTAARFTKGVELAERYHELTQQDPSCFDLHADGCVCLATARFYDNRSSDVSELLADAERSLDLMRDLVERTHTEMLICKLRIGIYSQSRPGEALQQAHRAYMLMNQLGLRDDAHDTIGIIVLLAARVRNEGDLRYFCNELLRTLRGGDAATLPFSAVSDAIRASLALGNIFLAREIFEAWNELSPPLGVPDLISYSCLTSLFAQINGELTTAIEIALNAREEYLAVGATQRDMAWSMLHSYAKLRVILIPALATAGRYVEALELTEAMLVEGEEMEPRIPETTYFLELFRRWLRWRILFPVDAQISLVWPALSERSDTGKQNGNIRSSSNEAGRRSQEFRAFYSSTIAEASPIATFFAEMLLSMIDAVEERFDEAAAAIERAAAACRRAYDWRYELDTIIAATAIKLRRARYRIDEATELVGQAQEEIRELFAHLSEKGLAGRIAQLTALFVSDARSIPVSKGDPVSYIRKLGAAAHTAAHEVMRNSRLEQSGPIERTRLFVMGPLRLMRPYSYIELSESAFERETARTLLTALVSAELLGQRLTREELASQVAPKAKTPEQQKKALYNAASAARAACASSSSIIPVGASGLGVNVDPEVEGSIWVDALEIVRLVREGDGFEAAGATSRAFDRYRHALALARKGDFASDCYADWADGARDHMRETLRHAALRVGRLALRIGLHGTGIEAMSAQLIRDPFDEESHRLLMQLYADSGNRSAALKQFEKCKEMLNREFDVEPEQETLELRRMIG